MQLHLRIVIEIQIAMVAVGAPKSFCNVYSRNRWTEDSLVAKNTVWDA